MSDARIAWQLHTHVRNLGTDGAPPHTVLSSRPLSAVRCLLRPSQCAANRNRIGLPFRCNEGEGGEPSNRDILMRSKLNRTSAIDYTSVGVFIGIRRRSGILRETKSRARRVGACLVERFGVGPMADEVLCHRQVAHGCRPVKRRVAPLRTASYPFASDSLPLVFNAHPFASDSFPLVYDSM